MRDWLGHHKAVVGFVILALTNIYGIWLVGHNGKVDEWERCNSGNGTRMIIRQTFEKTNQRSLDFLKEFPIAPAVQELIDRDQKKFRDDMVKLGPTDCGPRP